MLISGRAYLAKVCISPLMSSKSADVISAYLAEVCISPLMSSVRVMQSLCSRWHVSMVIKSRGRFGASRDLEGSVSVRGEIRGGPPNQRNPYWILGLGRGRVGSCPGRGRVEVASRSGGGQILGLCSDSVNERTPVRFIRGW